MTTTIRAFEATPLWYFNAAPSLLHAALAYAAAEVAVFPLAPRDKHPLTRHGCYDATTNPRQIRAWWERWPQANIGLPCRAWWVLDIDPRHGGLDSLQQVLQDATPDSLHTRCQFTGGGGVHLVFGARTDLGGVTLPNTTTFAGLAGLDLRAAGGYIVGAPSVHRTGGVYRWHDTLPVLPFPDTLLARWMAHRRQILPSRTGPDPTLASWHADTFERFHPSGNAGPAVPGTYLRYALSQAITGQRNRYALYLACRLVLDLDLDWQQAAPWMCEYAGQVPQDDHPYTETEALNALNWALSQARAA